jgi:hypothetical protein
MKTTSASPIVAAVLAVVLAGCGTKNTVAPPVVQPGPVVEQFTATPSSIHAGDPVELTWSVRGSLASLLLDDGNGTVSDVRESTKIVLNPIARTTYTLTARNDAGSAVAQVVVSVASGGGERHTPRRDPE